MKIKSEYAILAECVERGANIGLARAYKRMDYPDENIIAKQEIFAAVMSEIAEYFAFDEENYE